MRRIIITTGLFLLPLLISAQFTGSGTYLDPYSGGVLTGDMTWSSSKVYVSGDLTIGTSGTQGHLTISQGVTVVFTAAGADIIVTGLGRITAQGTASEMIRFTADHDDDGIYGEAGETRGHIVFTSMNSAASLSLFSYCTLEYGDVRTGSNTTSYGGGFYIQGFNKVTIDRCTFRKNKATHGGAILLFNGSSPLISNTLITENTAVTSGGGIYSAARNNLLIFNCIITFNISGGGGGGGIYIDGSDNTRVVNSLFVKNTSTSESRGANVQIYAPGTTIRFSFINSVIWGSDNSISYYGISTSLATDFSFCALQDVTESASLFTSCIDLHSDNDNAAGPNFMATDGSDWSIKFLSPLRDAGTETFSGGTVPSTDYYGNSRIYKPDIGIHEYQYSCWKTDAGSTDWNTGANWYTALVPTSESHIVIPSGATNYPISSSAPDVTIGAGKYFIMEPGSRATVGNLTNNGIMQLKADASDFASLILNSYSRGGGGTEEIDFFLSGGGTEEDEDYKWHYISSPVSSLSTNVFTTITPDLAQYVESRPTLSLRQGWVAYDGYVYSTGLMNGPTFSNLSTGTNGKGYNYFDYYDHLYTFSGLLNTSTVTAPLGFSGNATLHGFNLLGNPFISGLDWNYIISDPGYPANTSKGLYFTRDNVQCTYIAGVGVPEDVNGIVPPMQGFFTKTYATGNSIVLSAAARTHGNIHPRYKGSGSGPVIPLVRLALAGRDLTDETVVRFDDEAKSGWDNDFDAGKMFTLETKTYICTQIGEELYSINGQPFPETMVEIPIVVNLLTDGSHTISAIQLQGLEYYKVRLVDLQANTSRELSTTPSYTFNSPKGLITDRFLLRISELAYSAETVPAVIIPFNIYRSFGKIYIVPENNLWEGKTGSVTIMDITGRVTGVTSNVGFSTGSAITVDSPEQTGVYLVDIRSGALRYTGRIVVR